MASRGIRHYLKCLKCQQVWTWVNKVHKHKCIADQLQEKFLLFCETLRLQCNNNNNKPDGPVEKKAKTSVMGPQWLIEQHQEKGLATTDRALARQVPGWLQYARDQLLEAKHGMVQMNLVEFQYGMRYDTSHFTHKMWEKVFPRCEWEQLSREIKQYYAQDSRQGVVPVFPPNLLLVLFFYLMKHPANQNLQMRQPSKGYPTLVAFRGGKWIGIKDYDVKETDDASGIVAAALAHILVTPHPTRIWTFSVQSHHLLRSELARVMSDLLEQCNALTSIPASQPTNVLRRMTFLPADRIMFQEVE